MTERRKPIPKTQKEISNDQIKPYDKAIGNPNDASKINDPKNRANQLTFKGDTVKPFSVGIQDIDESIVYYFQNVIKPIVYQNGTQIPVPIIYGSPERWKAVQRDGYYRDKDDKIMAPLIMFKRDTIEKNYSIGNKLDANNPNNYAVFTSKWSDRNSYDNFNVLNNRTPQKTYHAVVIPDYITLNYSCIVYTYYIEQMNKIVESINYASEAYWGDPQRFKFRARIDSFTTNTTLNQGEERLVRTEFSLKLYGYIIPDTINKSLNALNKFPDKTKFIFSVETANVLEDTETTSKDKNKNGGYRTNTNARFLDQTPLGAFQGINNVDIASVITSGSFTNPNLQLYRGDDTIISIDLRTLIPYTSSYALTASYALSSLSSSYTLNSVSSSYALSSSHALDAISSSYALTASYALNAGITIDTGSFVTTSSFNSFTSSYNTGSFTGSFIGNLLGTSSYSNNALSSSYASNALSSSHAISSSYTLSSSYASTASYTLNAISSSYASTASYSMFAETASLALAATQTNILVLNQSGNTINKGVVVRITGSNNSSDIPRVVTASYENDNNSANTLGITTQAISNGDQGFVITEGVLKGIDTSNFVSGQLIYLGATGSIIGTVPTAPLHTVRLGEVVRSQQNNGSIYVRIDNGYELDELHDVKITNATTGDLLIRSGSIWINSKILSGSYILSGSLTTNDGVNVQTITASFISASSGITGSLFGTSSWASNAVTSSYILNAVSSSFATTASYVLNAISSSFATTASFTTTASYVLNAVSSSFASTASFVTTAQTASYVLNAVSSSFASTASSVNILNQNVIVTGSINVSTSLFSPAVYGGSNSGNNLILGSTTNATKGNITFGSSNYSELNNTLGLGAAANSVDRLYIQGIGNTSATDAIQAVNSDTNVLFKLQDNGQLFMGPVSSSTAMGTSNALLFISQSLVTGSTHTTAVYGTLTNQNIFSRASNNGASTFGASNQYTLQIDPSQTTTGTTLIGKRDIINFSGSSPTSTTYILADILFAGGHITPIWRISAVSSSAVATNNAQTTTFFHQILISQNLTANSLTNTGGGVVIGGGGNSISMNVGPGIAIGTSNTITNTGGGTQFAIGLGNTTLGNGVSGIGNYVYHSSATSGVGAIVGVGSSTVGWGWGLGLVGSAGATGSAAIQLRLNGNIVQYRNAIINNANNTQAQQLGFGSYSNMPTLLIGGILPAQQGGVNINATTGVALITGSIINTMTTVGNSFTEPGTAIIATTGSNADIRLNQNWTNATAVYIGTVFSSSVDAVSGTGSLFIDWAPNTNAAQRIGTGGTPPTGSNYWVWIKPDEFRFSKVSGVATLNIDTAGKIGIWPDVTSSYSTNNELSAMLDINVGSVLNSNGQVSVSGSNIYPQIRLRGMSGNPSTAYTLDGSLWYLSTNSRLMIRQGSNTREIVTSSGSVGSSGSAAGSIDIVVNGTTYNVLYK